MANPNHLKRLKSATSEWNQWCEEEKMGFGSINLKGADLRGLCLKGVNLSNAQLQDSDLRRTDLSHARLGGANLDQANLESAKLFEANLELASLCEANLCNSDLSRANMFRTSFSGANLERAILHSAKLTESIFAMANLSRADLSKSNLQHSNLQYSNLSYANLSYADLSNSILAEANLTFSNLQNTKLIRASLDEANFSASMLQGANLSQTRCLGTIFSRATLTGVCIQDWKINAKTKLDGVEVDYIYNESHWNYKKGEYQFKKRTPSSRNFSLYEFSAIHETLDHTVSLLFEEGIDWKNFVHAIENIRLQDKRAEVEIHGFRKTLAGPLVELSYSPDYDRKAIEDLLVKNKVLESKLLNSKNERFRIQGRLEESRHQLSKVEGMTNINIGSTIGSQGSNHHNSDINIEQNPGKEIEEIARLLFSIREQVQSLPEESRDDTLDHLELVENEIQKSQPDKERMKRLLGKLSGAVATVGLVAGSTATFSGNLDTIIDNVSDLTEKLGIPREKIEIEQR